MQIPLRALRFMSRYLHPLALGSLVMRLRFDQLYSLQLEINHKN